MGTFILFTIGQDKSENMDMAKDVDALCLKLAEALKNNETPLAISGPNFNYSFKTNKE